MSEPTESAIAARPPAEDYATESVTITDVVTGVAVTGRVVPLQTATITSTLPGEVLASDKLLQAGKYYSKGEPIVRLDDEATRINLSAERSQLVATLAPLLGELELDYPGAFSVWKRFIDAVGPDDELPALPPMTDERLRYFLHSRGVPPLYYRIKAQESTLDDYVIRAPFSGQLTSASVQPGTYVSPGTPLAEITRTDVYEVRAAIPVDLVGKLSPGAVLDMKSRNLGETYRATLNRFDPNLDQATQTVTGYFRISGKGLRSGLYLEGNLSGQTLENVAALPREALRRDDTILYLNDEGVVQSQAVEVARMNADKVYLRGLTPGQQVIVEGGDASNLGVTTR